MVIDKNKRLKIVELYGRGMNNNQIATELGIHASTVKRWVDRYINDGNIDPLSRPGRPRSTSVEQDTDIIARFEAEPFVSSSQVSRECYFGGRNVIQRRLKEVGILCRRAAKKELVSELNQTRRLIYALQHFDGDAWNQWTLNTVFVDESTFKSTSNHQRHVYRREGERYNPNFIHFVKGSCFCVRWTTRR